MYSSGQVVCPHDCIYWGVISIILRDIIIIIIIIIINIIIINSIIIINFLYLATKILT